MPSKSSAEKYTCYHCSKEVNKENAVLCTRCSMPYHNSCATQSGILPNNAIKKCCDIEYVVQHHWTNIVSPGIDEKLQKKHTLIVNEVNKILGKYQKSNDEKLEKHKVELNKHIEQINSDIILIKDDIIEEIRQREIRSKNVIIYNIDESNDKNDLKTICSILIHASIPKKNIKIQRIGEKKPEIKRGIKLKLTSPKEVQKIFSNIQKIKPHLSENSYITSDKTPSQNKYYKNIKSELQDRVEKGETNIKIKWIKNILKIIQIDDDESKNEEA